VGTLPSSFPVVGNPIRRKRIDFTSSSEFAAYLRTRGEPHPALVDADASLASTSALATQADKEDVAKVIADGAHYGELRLVHKPRAAEGAAAAGTAAAGAAAARGRRSAAAPASGALAETEGAARREDGQLGAVPREVLRLGDRLRKLAVVGHGVASLPEGALRAFKVLANLDLSKNKLGGGGGGHAAAFLGDLAKLPRLEVSLHAPTRVARCATVVPEPRPRVPPMPPPESLRGARFGSFELLSPPPPSSFRCFVPFDQVLNLSENRLTDGDVKGGLKAVGIDGAFPCLGDLDVSRNALASVPAPFLNRAWHLVTFSCAYNQVGVVRAPPPLLPV